MRKLLFLTVLTVLTIATLALAGCARDSEDTVSGTGTVTFVELEGGFYGILGDDGQHYDPINLGQEFRQDGLRVRFEAKVRDDLASTHQWGTLIEITRIERVR